MPAASVSIHSMRRRSTIRAGSGSRSSFDIGVTITAGASPAGAGSVERRRLAEGDGGEVVVGAVGAQRVHEDAGLDVAIRARERAAVDVARAAGERERAVDDARGGL